MAAAYSAVCTREREMTGVLHVYVTFMPLSIAQLFTISDASEAANREACAGHVYDHVPQ